MSDIMYGTENENSSLSPGGIGLYEGAFTLIVVGLMAPASLGAGTVKEQPKWINIVGERVVSVDLTRVNYPALLALTRSLRAGLARRLVGWDSPARSRLVAQGQTPAAM